MKHKKETKAEKQTKQTSNRYIATIDFEPTTSWRNPRSGRVCEAPELDHPARSRGSHYQPTSNRLTLVQASATGKTYETVQHSKPVLIVRLVQDTRKRRRQEKRTSVRFRVRSVTELSRPPACSTTTETRSENSKIQAGLETVFRSSTLYTPPR